MTDQPRDAIPQPFRDTASRKPVVVFMATDNRARWGCAAAIRSVVDNARPGATLRFFIATSSVSAADRAKLLRCGGRKDLSSQVQTFEFDIALANSFLTSKNIPPIAYAWLFVDRFLPDAPERCVCLDVDLLFEHDVEELATVDLNGSTIGAVLDGDEDHCRRQMTRLGLPGSRYLNSGVMVIDMVRWRDLRYEEKAVDFARHREDMFGTHDQDTINAVIDGDWMELPKEWNTWVSQADSARNRRVLHFTSVPKPWHADYQGPFRDRFLKYLRRTPYRRFSPWNPLGLGALLTAAKRRIPHGPKLRRLVRRFLKGGR